MKTEVCAFLAAFAGVAHFANGNDIVKQVFKESRQRMTMERSQKLHNGSIRRAPATCQDGLALVDGVNYPCKDIDFLSFIGSDELLVPNVGGSPESSDIWGYLSPSGQEITLLGLVNGVAVIDSTDAANPCIIAKLPNQRKPDSWVDIKVFQDTMYVISDLSSAEAPASADLAVQVYDLLQFDAVDCSAENYEIPIVLPTSEVRNHGRSHNVIVNTESGRLYTVGATTCSGGFNVFDLNVDRLNPVFLGCIDEDGYTHDAQCVTYFGPDQNFQGKEICLAFNEDTLTIWDATVLPATMLSRKFYPNQAYSHQGWFTRDMKHVLLDDELDELCNETPQPGFCSSLVTGELTGVHTTSTSVFDVTDLTNAVLVEQLIWETESIDHNMYCWGCIHEKGWGGNAPLEFFPDPNYMYMSNYMSGIRVIDVHSAVPGEWGEVGFFDVHPQADEIEFEGTWSNYMHPSGVLAVSSIESGIYFLKPNMAFSVDFPPPPVQTDAPTVVVETEAPTLADTPTSSPTIQVDPPTSSPSATTPTSSPVASTPATDAPTSDSTTTQGPSTESPASDVPVPLIASFVVVLIAIVVLLGVIIATGKKANATAPTNTAEDTKESL